MQYMQPLETAYAYDFWCALWLMSLAVGRSITVGRPRIPVYMNWYIVLCAESGMTRKSTAVKFARTIAALFVACCKADNKLLGKDVFDDKTTPEQFEAILHKRSAEQGFVHISLAISELVRFLGRERYTMALPGLLTDMYDCPEYRTGPGTLSRGEVTFRQVFVSFLSASTPTWLVRAINPDVIEGGFTSRVVFVHAEKRKRKVAWPEEVSSAEVGEQANRMIEDLTGFAEAVLQHNQILLTDAAMRKYTRWYNSLKPTSDAYRTSWQARQDEHVLRLAAMLAINDGACEIQNEHITKALAVIEEVKEDGAKLFEGTFVRDDVLIAIEKLRNIFLEQGLGLISTTDILKKVRNYMNGEELALTLGVMHELNMVQKFTSSETGKGRKRTSWRGTKLLMSKDAIGQLMESLHE